jgi:hypothetical protein
MSSGGLFFMMIIAAAAMANANAIKATGGIVHLEPSVFMKLFTADSATLVVASEEFGFLGNRRYKYVTSYKGLTFFTESKTSLSLPTEAEVLTAVKIKMPAL